MHSKIKQITERVKIRSNKSRSIYLKQIEEYQQKGPQRNRLHCSNLAHGFAACTWQDKARLRETQQPNIAIISAYNDMLSAHQPYESYPEKIKKAIFEKGATAQFAGGVPAMCDGVTQGQPGMDLSLLSRDVIALSTAIALSHNMFDGGLLLGICDKIVPGLLIGALSFGHLPFIFVPAGPMPSGISNQEKAKIRQLYAEGKVGKEALLEVEAAAYHSPGTCTFYGTANSNQLLVELMGLQLPGSSFINPNTDLREKFTRAAAQRIVDITALTNDYLPISEIITPESIVNGVTGLLASGGSTNHTMHLIAIARAAGIILNWDDFAELSAVIPLVAKIYPNGSADINHFQKAGGMAFLIQTLLNHELLNTNVKTVYGKGLELYCQQPIIKNHLEWEKIEDYSLDETVLRSITNPFKAEGGVKVLNGNLGRAIFKSSALKEENYSVTAPAIVFSSQEEFELAFERGDLNKDCVVVVRFQGPRARGMPELHKLTPLLGVLQDKGFKVALVTDGRMSGASGRIPAAIHVTPEALDNGMIAKIENGDVINVDGRNGCLELMVSAKEFNNRTPAKAQLEREHWGMGRELFTRLRDQFSSAEDGACSLFTKETING